MKLLTLALVAIAVAAQAAQRPNVILFLVDDFGHECIGANGGTSYQTPNVDKLAATGMRFTHGYAQPLCTPTRTQIMTGLYNVRNYTRFGQLEPSQKTFAHLFKAAGYRTCIVGKWQLGGGFEGPQHFGFDEYCLWQLTRRPPRYANPGVEMNGKEVDYNDGEYGPDIVDGYAREFIARNKDKPFLLYYPFMLTHDPFQPTPDSTDWDPKAVGERANRDVTHFADMTAYMDKIVGKVVATLEENGLRDNTLILLTGDNGTGTSVTSRMGDRVVRGGKGSTKDHGIHVPLIASWPNQIPAGKVCDDLVDSSDYLPTMCAAAGIEVPATMPIDGRSFWPQLRGEKGTPREWMYFWYGRDGGAKTPHEFAMNHQFKLYRDGRLFDWKADLSETQPLNTTNLKPEATAAREALQKALDHYQDARPAAIAAQGAQMGAGEGKGGAAPKAAKGKKRKRAAK